MMKKKIYLSVDWDSRSISVSTKNDWDEYKESVWNKWIEYLDREE